MKKKFTSKLPNPKVINKDLLRDARVPQRFWRDSSDDFKGSAESLLRVRRFASRFQQMRREGVGVFLYGPTRSYKTWLATHFCKLVLSEGHSAIYYAADELVDLYFNRGAEPINYFDRFRHSDLVVFDGLDIPETKIVKPVFEKGVRAAFDTGCCVCICSMLNLKDVAENYGPVFAKRISSHSIPVECMAQDDFDHAAEQEVRFQKFNLTETEDDND